MDLPVKLIEQVPAIAAVCLMFLVCVKILSNSIGKLFEAHVARIEKIFDNNSVVIKENSNVILALIESRGRLSAVLDRVVGVLDTLDRERRMGRHEN